MPASRRGALALAAVALAGLPGCGHGSDTEGGTGSATPATVQEGVVAAVAVAAGDCLNGIVLGTAERREIDTARVVPCEGAHALEVFATFDLDRDALGLDDEDDLAPYPGRARVVPAAEEGCADEIESHVEDPERYGLIALWPSEDSWATGDRVVACAVFAADGTTFDRREL